MPLTAESCESAIRLVLRSWNLGAGAHIAMPAFVCNSVRRAVRAEYLTPLELDLHSNSFWTDYNAQSMQQRKVEGIVLVHLYGFLHPQSAAIEAFAKQHNIPLLHDLAQCVGVDESGLDPAFPRVYSFSQGKAATAAFGGLIKNMDVGFYKKHIRSVLNPLLRKRTALQFMKSRIYGYQLTMWDGLELKAIRLFSAFRKRAVLTPMTSFQKKAAARAMQLQTQHLSDRKKRHQTLVAAAESSGKFKLLENATQGLFYKAVFLLQGDCIDATLAYLRTNKLPFFMLAPDIPANKELPNFAAQAHRIIEIPCEASIPFDEIQRLEVILKSA